MRTSAVGLDEQPAPGRKFLPADIEDINRELREIQRIIPDNIGALSEKEKRLREFSLLCDHGVIEVHEWAPLMPWSRKIFPKALPDVAQELGYEITGIAVHRFSRFSPKHIQKCVAGILAEGRTLLLVPEVESYFAAGFRLDASQCVVFPSQWEIKGKPAYIHSICFLMTAEGSRFDPERPYEHRVKCHREYLTISCLERISRGF